MTATTSSAPWTEDGELEHPKHTGDPTRGKDQTA